MADEKPAPKPDPFVEIVWMLMALFLFISALNSIGAFLARGGINSSSLYKFTPRGVILASTDPISSLSNPIGTKFVVTSRYADVYDTPGGKVVDRKELGDKGVIVGGPVDIGGERYWRVRFSDGSEGWIKEKDIASIENKDLSLTARIIIFFWKLLSLVKILIILVSLLFVYLIFYLYRQIVRLRKEEQERLYSHPITETDIISNNSNPRWERILEDTASENPNDWRSAIMEADIMLDELLDTIQANGESTGDKLKSIEKPDFLTIDLAWEAHKFRNNIAHEGSNFLLNNREVKRIISLYEQVFKEFGII